jgi:glycosyltransferase involved in cell wall biosynthesis
MAGGGEYSFLELSYNLQYLWDIICFVPSDGELASRLRSRGLNTLIVPIPPIRPWFIVQIISTLKAYLSFFRKYQPSLLYANGSRAAFYAGIVGRLLRLPVLWHCRIIDPDPYLDPILCRLCHQIIANSEATAHRFKHVFRSKTTILYNGVDLEWLSDRSSEQPEQIKKDWKVILVVSQVSRNKRHDLIISSFERIAALQQDAHLVCVGPMDSSDHQWWSYIQNRTRESEFTDRIHWIGEVSDPRAWYRSAYMLVLASEKESFGRVLVEAMACGVPVIATETGGIPEIIRNGQDGILVPPGRDQEIADAMLRLLKDDLLRRRLSESSSERAKSFSLPRLIEGMNRVFEASLS